MPDTEYDITTLREGTVDSIVEKLGDLSLPQLRSLDQLERETLGDKARTTLLDPIAKEIAKREAPAEDTGATGGTATGSAITADPITETVQAPAPKTYTEAELSAIIAEKERVWRGEADAAVAEALRLQEAEIASRPTESVAPPAPIEALVIGAAGAAFTTYVERYAVHIVFVDTDDRPLPDSALPMIEARPGQFETIGDSAIYLSDIEFPVHGVQTEVAGAFLLDDDLEPLAKAELAMPVRVGGGTPHKLAGRSLYFSRPAG